MKLWYNPALKTDKVSVAHVHLRNVKYRQGAGYTSNAGTIELPIISKEADEQDNISFGNVALGIDADNSTGKSASVSVAMGAISWALPLDRDNTYLAIGFQGAYTFTRIQYDGYLYFPDGFDRNGPIGLAIAADPAQTGFTYEYFTAGAGVAVRRQWYIGASVRHFNRPLTDPSQSSSFRVPRNYWIQAGYTTVVTDKVSIGAYGNFGWQGSLHEHIIGSTFTRNLNDIANSAVSIGLGYRVGETMIPNLEFRFRKSRFSFYYEFNVASGPVYSKRSGYELSYSLVL
jgi:Type IX secretion system membrane protein PorP/SprF